MVVQRFAGQRMKDAMEVKRREAGDAGELGSSVLAKV